MKINWMLILKVDGEAKENVFPYEDEEQAREHFEYFSQAWTEVYLCKVTKGPRDHGVRL
jgi:hypothetical protein